MKKGKITESVAFKVLLFFVLGISFLVSCLSALIAAVLWDGGAYTQSHEEYMKSMLRNKVNQHYQYICRDTEEFPALTDMERAFGYVTQYNNLSFSIVRQSDGRIVWSNMQGNSGSSPKYQDTFYRDELYMLTVRVDIALDRDDEIKSLYRQADALYQNRNLWLACILGGVLVFFVSFIWLMCSAGHKRGQEGITPSVLTSIYLDLFTVFFGAGALFMAAVVLMVCDELESGEILLFGVALAVGGMLEVVWCTIYLREFALRMKLGKWWKHSLIYVVCRFLIRMVKKLAYALGRLLAGLPVILPVVGFLLFFLFCELVGIMLWGEAELFACWVFEKLLLVPVILYCALAFWKLQKGSFDLAQGNLSGKLNTRYLLFAFKEHGENLNRINDGISQAVEQRLQSERLKTELITNVSHDLKTPLTSIINYADLLGSAAAVGAEENAEQIQEYSEVLLRQSGRLKKLLDDLVDASKATTGNLEVNLEPCELGVLLTQVQGEYETRLEEKELALHVTRPEGEVRILADGRHLWRVFDNLMNNICKYAQEGSRVYLNLEQRGDVVEIIFRNMSKYELNISPKELEERFVRGDASRHMEGSGLGLSIAKSLVELQRGSMEILTDGDLFKVILQFSVLD